MRRGSSEWRGLVAIVVIAAMSGTGRTAAAARSGVQYTPDYVEALVNKNVGAERWAIARDNATGDVSGNVFVPNGSVSFVWCEQTGLTPEVLRLACYGADACDRAPCTISEWTSIGSVELPPTFFAAPGYGLPERFVDQGATVVDNQTGLEWEKKTGGDGSPNPEDPTDVDNQYSWGVGAAPWGPIGTVFSEFLARLNGGGGPNTCLAGHCDWRLPTQEELEGILATPCSATPCIPQALAPMNDSVRSVYWSATTYGPLPDSAMAVNFAVGRTLPYQKGSSGLYARAVRNGERDLKPPFGPEPPLPTPTPEPYGSPSRAFVDGPSASLLD